MPVVWMNSLASTFVPPARAVYQLDGDAVGLVAYLDQYAAEHTTGGHTVTGTVLSWRRWVYDRPSDSYVLGPDADTLTVPSSGVVIATAQTDPPAPAVFDTTGWWMCDQTGRALDVRDLSHTWEIRSVSGSVTVTTDPAFTGGAVWPAGVTIERPIIWTTPAPIVPTGVLVRGEAGVLGAGKTVATPKDGTVTTTGCTIQARNVSGGTVVVNAASPVTYIAQALYLHIEGT